MCGAANPPTTAGPNLYIPVPKGATTPKWVEVGSRLDTMNDITWEFTATTYRQPGCNTFTDQSDCIAAPAWDHPHASLPMTHTL